MTYMTQAPCILTLAGNGSFYLVLQRIHSIIPWPSCFWGCPEAESQSRECPTRDILLLLKVKTGRKEVAGPRIRLALPPCPTSFSTGPTSYRVPPPPSSTMDYLTRLEHITPGDGPSSKLYCLKINKHHWFLSFIFTSSLSSTIFNWEKYPVLLVRQRPE